MGDHSQRKRKQKVQWPQEAERKLIEVWADVLQRYGGAQVKKKAKAQKAADILNVYVQDEINEGLHYTAEEVIAKIDNTIAKARRIYNKFPRQKETGRAAGDEDINVDTETASLAWPNFQTFHDLFRNHPLLCPGIAGDSSVFLKPVVDVTPEATDDSHVADTMSITPATPPTPTGRYYYVYTEDTDNEDVRHPTKRERIEEQKATFLECLAAQQKEAQIRQFQHEMRQQQMLQEFEDKRERERQKFELEMRGREEETKIRLERDRLQFQQTMLQQQQLFQAELFKRLFDGSRDK